MLSDFDRDGIADEWEARCGFHTNTVADAVLDADADGMSNRDEYLASTHATRRAKPLEAHACREWDRGTESSVLRGLKSHLQRARRAESARDGVGENAACRNSTEQPPGNRDRSCCASSATLLSRGHAKWL